jgi:hypothetical protein
MSREQATLTQEVADVQVARWEGFRRLAKSLPNHRVLALELFRTINDETVAVYTAVRDGEPVRYLLRGDSRGRLLPTREVEPTDDPTCTPRAATAMTASDMQEALDNTGIDPNMSYGRPPPSVPIPPNLVDSGEAALLNTFGSGS